MKPNALPINEIICGDNVETMQTFPADSIDLVITSPPYDNLRTYGGHTWDFEGVASELWRVIKPGGVVVWVVADATIDGSETGTSFRQALRFMDIGFRLHDTMIYDKGFAKFSQSNRYGQSFEFMFVLSSGSPTRFNAVKRKTTMFGRQHGTRITDRTTCGNTTESVAVVGEYANERNVWLIDNGYCRSTSDRIAFDHDAIFPEKLARDHILSWSNEGDIVLDPFGGSGTTAKMAKLMGRKYIGIEINQEYCEIANNRLRQGVFEYAESAE